MAAAPPVPAPPPLPAAPVGCTSVPAAPDPPPPAAPVDGIIQCPVRVPPSGAAGCLHTSLQFCRQVSLQRPRQVAARGALAETILVGNFDESSLIGDAHIA